MIAHGIGDDRRLHVVSDVVKNGGARRRVGCAVVLPSAVLTRDTRVADEVKIGSRPPVESEHEKLRRANIPARDGHKSEDERVSSCPTQARRSHCAHSHLFAHWIERWPAWSVRDGRESQVHWPTEWPPFTAP